MKILPYAILIAAVINASAQSVRINEIMAANVTTYPDNTDFDDYSDWIELANTSDQAVSLDGYYLSDDPDRPLKWAIPGGAQISAKGFLVLRADGFDAAPEERFRRAFAPWDHFLTRVHHTNFKLAEEGESLVLTQVDSERFGSLHLIRLGTTWRYLDDGSDPGPLWAETGFDDARWRSGPAQLGYGEDDQATTIQYGADADAKFPATYFRTTFEEVSPESLTNIKLRLLADDGAVVYLNGNEVARIRMDPGAINYRSYASGRAREDDFDVVALTPDQFRTGVNVIAVQVHQVSGGSSDLSFDLEMVADRIPDEFERIDEIVFGRQIADVSYGRGDDGWAFFGEPTPGAANSTVPTVDLEFSSEVVFNVEGGFYNEPQYLNLTTSNPEAVIHYTTDGAWPTRSSPRYGDPIAVNVTTVIRARTFEEGKLPGASTTETFFIDAPKHDLPVITLAVDPEIFFDDTLGIYENVYKGREAPLNLAYYTRDQVLQFQVNAGAKIAGENIWRFAQKPMNLALRGKYGDDAIGYQLFPSIRQASFTRLTLRNGGDNWDDDMLRDALTPRIMRGQMANDVEDYQPAVVYLNGQYWGIHNLRLSLDGTYFATHHQVDPDNYDHLEFGHITSNAVTLGAKEGGLDDYLALETYAANNDLSDPTHYAYMESRMDIDNFIDFICIEDFVNNTSWRHNREFWRERKEGAKWRWIVPDLDRGLNTANQTTSLLDNFEEDYELFGDLMANDRFRARLAQRYAVHLSSTFHPDRIAAIVDEADAEVRIEMERHIERWRRDDGIQSMVARQEQLDEIKEFARERAPHVYSDFQQNFDMPETVRVTVNISPAEGGRVRMNGVLMLPHYSDTVELFQGLGSEILAEPSPGYEFVGWNTGESSARIAFDTDVNKALTATFRLTNEMVLPPVIESDLTLETDRAYASHGDVIVARGATLTIPDGVVLRLGPLADLRVLGRLHIAGTEANPVRIESRTSGHRWGAIAIVDGEGISRLSHAIIRGGTLGGNPLLERGTISVVRSTVEMDHLDMDDVLNPVFGWESKVTLRSSHIHTPFTGDGINVKHGEGLVEDCTFLGNTARDTDAIDFDDVVNGMIRNNRIYAFRGPNSDGIDVGEGCVDLLVTGNRIYNNSDKGISVGQGSKVRIERNLIVGCAQGIGIKDTGSTAWIDQNTFVGCGYGVAVFEKNLDAGGGIAHISNSIFSRSKQSPVWADSLSQMDVSYSLSDTLLLDGDQNQSGDPGFTDPGAYDFSLLPASPARDGGDPSHPRDDDGSRADLGAYYTYDPNDYPFHVPNVIVINEILSHSHDEAPDWIELHNTSNASVDISGWFLSDAKSNLQKYQIADGTTLPAKGYLVFYENETFGKASVDPGRSTAFALSENGETVYLYAPGDGLMLDYLEEESFGPSPTGITKGRYLKSTNTYNFIAMTAPTPGAPNSAPAVGPIVISEIMYRPDQDGDAEYIELLSVSEGAVTLYDPLKETGWRFTDGIVFDFPATNPVSIASGERILLVRDETAFRARFTEVPDSVRVYEWVNSGLSNGGERLELSRPGDVDEQGTRRWIRIDRVNYGDGDLWPVEADGGGLSLTRVDESAYGNDVANWKAAVPTPGGRESTADPEPAGYEAWAQAFGLSAFTEDDDGDAVINGLEYALGMDPFSRDVTPSPMFKVRGELREWRFPVAARSGVDYVIEISEDLRAWRPVETIADQGEAIVHAMIQENQKNQYVRLKVTLTAR